MKNKKNTDFKFEETTNKLFSKINIVNNLTLKEIQIFNEKYRELGLFIKQIRVDKFGNEKSQEDLIFNNYLSKKRLLKRHSTMTLEQLYFKYFCYDSFLNKPKYLRSSNNENDDQLYNNDDLKELKKNLEDIHKDYQKLHLKKCRMKNKEFKDIIISYIPKFNKHLTPYQYKQIYNKMKDKVQLYIDPTNVDDINLWPIPILKEFKAEIEILAISNIINQKIGIYINEEENVNSEREIKSKIKKEKISDNSIDSDISENSL